MMLPLAVATALATLLVSPLAIDFTVNVRATAERGGSAVIGGTVTCSADTLVTIEGEVAEALNRSAVAIGTFTTEVLCGTTATAWSATVNSDSGVPFRPGFASGDVRVIGFDPESGIFSGVQSLVFLHLTRSEH